MKVRFAVSPPRSALEDAEFPLYLDECERLGFDTMWLSDIPLGGLGDPLINLTFAAAYTSRLKLGANLVPLGRHPYWLAKQLAQLDRLSHGRLLISLVPGLGQPAERKALGYPTGNRGKVVDEMIALMRRWWAGETVNQQWRGYEFEDIAVEPTPMQEPLELWLGGISAMALERVANLADGWLTSAATPAEAGAGRTAIERRAQEIGRVVDIDHFGISIPYCLEKPEEIALDSLRRRRKDRDLTDIVALGPTELHRLTNAHIGEGLSKFVVRPLDVLSNSVPWRDDLRWLADAVLPLQT